MKKSCSILYDLAKTALLFLGFILFSSSLFAQPSNDECNNAVNRVSNTTCNNGTYSLRNATASSFTISGSPCVTGTHFDVWFQFTASGTDQTATISNLGGGITNPEVAIFSGTCAGTLTQLACGTTTATASGLTIGTVYYVRVSNVGSGITSNNANFDICIVHYNPPSNDNCSNAISRTSSTSCNNTSYNIRRATPSSFTISGVPCVSGVHYDIWFSFTAAGNTQTATISSLASGFTNPEVAIFSGTCAGTLTQLACGTTTATATGLTIGTTYYVRISNVGSFVVNNGNFDLCITHPPPPPVNDNCTGATVLTAASTCNNVTGNLQYATSAGPSGPGAPCAGTISTTYDVWYSFVATSTLHAVTVSNLGSNLNATTTYMQLFSGTCGSLTSLGCQPVSTTNGRLTNAFLTIGAIYYVRVYVTTNPTSSPTSNWNFSICLQQPPPNDNCTGAINLTSGATCSNTTGTLDLAIPSIVLVAAGCVAAGIYYDVWYSFAATSASQTITLSSLGANFTTANARIQVFSGACAGLTAIGCSSGITHTQNLLTIGATYYVRIASYSPPLPAVPTAPPYGPGTAGQFNICITAAPSPPSNDACANAIQLISGTTCSNTAGTLIRATASAPVVPGTCGNAAAPDVWFSFVAQSAFPIINLSSIGANMQTNGRVQLLTGSCAGLVPVGTCHSIPLSATTTINTITNPGGDGLIIGQTYYIRITHFNSLVLPLIAGTYTFNICVTDPVPVARTIIDYAKSYVNLTDSTGGGTINPGDILEIRATLVIRGAKTIDSVAFYDTLVSNSGLSLIDNSIATRTNEGKLFASFTGSSLDADAGWYTTAGAGSDTFIRINPGATTVPTATRTNKTSLSNSSRPNLFGNTACIVMATYRVTVTAAYGTKINFGGGSFTYRDQTSGGFGVKIDFPKDSLMVFQSPAACPDNVAQTNILGDEFGGTFGAAASSASANQNRGTSPSTSYQYQPFVAPNLGPNDYFYAIANNTSTNHTIVQTVPKPTAAPPRLFGHWDVSGDHTGATNTYKGNLPCNPGLPVGPNNPCGYMLVVNAAYRTDAAFTFNVTAACPNTYYEISSWVKNLCYRCGSDVNGVASNGAGYGPSGPGDSSGVKPNLAYEINGVDYYTTGNMTYQGLGGTNSGSDTLNGWVRRSFVYLTGPAQTDFSIAIRNNAPGGGGNDWAMDDISLRTCLPSFQMTPTNNPVFCRNGSIDMGVIVGSNYNSYQYYQWERSTDGGVNWGPAPEMPGVQTFSYTNDGVNYKDTIAYPTILATESINGYQYRIRSASTIANLSSTSCSVANNNDVITINVQSSCEVLPVEILKFNVQLKDEHSILNWSVKQEQNLLMYEIERSSDGKNFTKIGTVNAKGLNAAEEFYLFNDPAAVLGKIYYRLKLINQDKNYKYSNILSVSLTKANVFELTNLVNPFNTKLSFQVLTYQNDLADLELLDASGRKMFNRKISLAKGINALSFDVPEHLQRGSYLLRIKSNAGVVNKVIQKL